MSLNSSDGMHSLYVTLFLTISSKEIMHWTDKMDSENSDVRNKSLSMVSVALSSKENVAPVKVLKNTLIKKIYLSRFSYCTFNSIWIPNKNYDVLKISIQWLSSPSFMSLLWSRGFYPIRGSRDSKCKSKYTLNVIDIHTLHHFTNKKVSSVLPFQIPFYFVFWAIFKY